MPFNPISISSHSCSTTLLLLFQEPSTLKAFQQQEDQIQRTILVALVPVVVAFSFFVFIFYRARREAHFKQREASLKLSIVQGELKALRAQINPHFIFNCMNSIHHFMHSNPGQAGDYLIKFSSLIRHVLESSAQRMIPLADEIEANRNYLQLEQLRLNHSFQFKFEVNGGLDAQKVHVPPMLIQPFLENSIWHGINNNGPEGKIDIHFLIKDDLHIQCVITDNGQEGIKPDLDLSQKVKKTSMGLSLIQDRFNTLNALHRSQAGFEINKSSPNGKSVTITIPFED